MQSEWVVDTSKINSCKFNFNLCHKNHPSDWRGEGALLCFGETSDYGFLFTGGLRSRRKMFLPTIDEDVIMVHKNTASTFLPLYPEDDPIEGDWFESNWVND